MILQLINNYYKTGFLISWFYWAYVEIFKVEKDTMGKKKLVNDFF